MSKPGRKDIICTVPIVIVVVTVVGAVIICHGVGPRWWHTGLSLPRQSCRPSYALAPACLHLCSIAWHVENDKNCYWAMGSIICREY